MGRFTRLPPSSRPPCRWLPVLILPILILLLMAASPFSAEYDWYEGTAAKDNGATRDFYNREAQLPWRTAMGDWRDADGVAQGAKPFGSTSLTAFGAGRWIEIDVTSLVRQWLDGTHPNKGMLLRLFSGSTTHLFCSREEADQSRRPQLVIEQDSDQRTLSPSADTYLDQSTYQGFGDAAQLRVSGGSTILLRFDLSGIAAGTSLTRATLRLYDYQQYSGTAELGVFRCDHGHEQPGAVRGTGLAAKYPYDAGLGSDSGVLFFTGFESSTWQTEWSSVSPQQNFVQLDADAANGFAPLRGKAVRARIAQGSNNGGSIIYKFAGKTGSEPEEIYWRYYLRLGRNWNPTVDGGKLPGIAGTYGVAGWGGRPVHGDDGWSARGNFGVQLSPDNPLGKKNPIGYYCYHMDMVGDYGHTWRWPIGYRGYLENDRWYCIEQYVKLNTPGQHDGVLRGWVDGFPAFEKTDLSFRSVNTLKIEEIWMNLYHGGTAVSPVDMDQYYDNVVIARQYIGPMTPGTTAARFSRRAALGTRPALVVRDGVVHAQVRSPRSEPVTVRLHDPAGRTVSFVRTASGSFRTGVRAPALVICTVQGAGSAPVIVLPASR